MCYYLNLHSIFITILGCYSINNTLLQSVEQHKYLGVLLHNSMSWSNHIQEVINKASKTLNFVKQTSANHVLKYATLVRPILEYARSLPAILN